MKSRSPFSYELGSWIPVTLLATVLALTLGQILLFNGGVLVYNMDDPYIGYALAEEIARGNYGINPGEVTSPASTILWPFLLAPVIHLPGGIWIPLLVNVACVLLATHVIYGSLASGFREAAPDDDESVRGLGGSWRPLAIAGAIIGVLLLNLTFVTFAGMEHGPQVLLAVVATAGLVEWLRSDGGSPSKTLLLALWLGPLVRFEALALTVPALVLLFLRGHRREATAVGVAVTLPIAAFVAFLTANAIGPVPSSIAVRSPELTGGGVLDGIVANAWRAQLSRPGLVLLLLLIPFLTLPFDRERSRGERALAGWLLAAVALHFGFGQFGYWGRYEAYLWGSVLIATGYLARRWLVGWTIRMGRARALVTAGLVAALLTWPYARDALKTPLASNDIFIEQREMNRLATDFVQGPVAVNDVGYVAFRNDHYVLDLFGLTSHAIREARQSAGFDVTWMDELVRQHDVDLVMVYVGGQWLSRFPRNWTPLGRLQIERFKALVPERQVTLFATRSEVAGDLRAKLEAWGEGLPEGSRVELVGAGELGLVPTGAGAGETSRIP